MKVKIGIILNIMAGAFGASAYNVNGVVADVSGQGEPFATYRIYAANDSVKPVSIGVTDVDGRFVQSLDSAGRYRITVQAVNKKPILPQESEIASNTRARSAKLRIAEKEEK